MKQIKYINFANLITHAILFLMIYGRMLIKCQIDFTDTIYNA